MGHQRAETNQQFSVKLAATAIRLNMMVWIKPMSRLSVLLTIATTASGYHGTVPLDVLISTLNVYSVATMTQPVNRVACASLMPVSTNVRKFSLPSKLSLTQYAREIKIFENFVK